MSLRTSVCIPDSTEVLDVIFLNDCLLLVTKVCSKVLNLVEMKMLKTEADYFVVKNRNLLIFIEFTFLTDWLTQNTDCNCYICVNTHTSRTIDGPMGPPIYTPHH